MEYYDNPWMYLPVGIFVLLALVASWPLYLHARRNRKPFTPPRGIGRAVDYSVGSRAQWADFARRVASTPQHYEQAALMALGPATFDHAMRQSETLTPKPRKGQFPPGMVFIDNPNVTTQPESVSTVTPEPKPVFFKDGEPERLGEYEGQQHVVEYLQAVVDALPKGDLVPKEHQLFLGLAGLGKTLLAKCFANTLAERNKTLGLPDVWFQEEFPADLPDLKALDRAVRKASERPTVLFIDEIHDLKSEGHFLKLYLLMEEGRYKFEGEEFPVEVPNVCLVGATTDYGSLHPALQRRFNRHALQPLTRQQITLIVQSRSFPVTPDATSALVDRTHFSGAPWEALQLYRQAMQFARARQSGHVALTDVQRVFESQQIDEMGLRWLDRAVMRVLLGQPKWRNNKTAPGGREFVCYAASENDTCVMAQVDKGEYRESIKPRLMSRGLLQVRATYGQALTPKAVEAYGHLAQL